MIVVADASPLIVLVTIAHVDVLPKLFGGVYIPPQVAAELAQANRPDEIRAFIATAPPWLVVQATTFVQTFPALHAGESAALNLAREINADLLLIDETEGRRVAAKAGIRVTGTVGVLELAARAKLLDLADAFERVKRTDFWISPVLLDRRLKLFGKRS